MIWRVNIKKQIKDAEQLIKCFGKSKTLWWGSN